MSIHQTNKNDEIDLRELFLILWRGKLYIFFFSFLFAFFASMYLQGAERLYLVEYKLKPVGQTQQKAFAGLGGFASLAGIQLPSNSTTDFMIFKELINSVEVSKIIMNNKSIIKKIYSNEWNESSKSFSEPSKNKLATYIGFLKKIISGNKVNYIPPNGRRLAMYISKNISIKEDKKTGFLTLEAKTAKPKMLSLLISEVIETSDQIMRQRYINFSKEPLSFYKEKLRTARSREHRESLAGLIAKEEQKLMFASKGKYFTAEPYIDARISLHPIAPKSKLILLFSFMIGSIIGIIIIYLRSLVLRDKK